jgi:hypothetical protein
MRIRILVQNKECWKELGVFSINDRIRRYGKDRRRTSAEAGSLVQAQRKKRS